MLNPLKPHTNYLYNFSITRRDPGNSTIKLYTVPYDILVRIIYHIIRFNKTNKISIGTRNLFRQLMVVIQRSIFIYIYIYVMAKKIDLPFFQIW